VDPPANTQPSGLHATIHGHVMHEGGLGRGVEVRARRDGDPAAKITVTDDRGMFELRGLVAGRYRLTFAAGTSHATRDVTVAAGQSLWLDVMVGHDHHNIPAPYGAPPARRRTV
jgi:hypothetical protein